MELELTHNRWRVGKWCDCEASDYPWFACDSTARFGIGYPSKTFRTFGEAIHYADMMAMFLSVSDAEIIYDVLRTGLDGVLK